MATLGEEIDKSKIASESESQGSVESLPPRARRSRRGMRALENEKEVEGLQENQVAVEEKTPPKDYDNFEYRDHTADIQLHSWGTTLAEAFEGQVMAMFGYMTDIKTVDIDPSVTFEFEAEGHDLDSLLYNMMDEFLYRFATEEIICREVHILKLDDKEFKLTAQGKGERFDLAKHPQGTEIKAITYSAMQIHQKPEDKRYDVYVIVDI